MGHLSTDEFFKQLGQLLASRKDKNHGSIQLSQKRLTYGQDDTPMTSEDKPFPDIQLEQPLPILIRATNAKGKEDRAEKIKLSTLVEPDALDAFYSRYADICKTGMVALKPRDRSKKKAKARKKRGGAPANAS